MSNCFRLIFGNKNISITVAVLSASTLLSGHSHAEASQRHMVETLILQSTKKHDLFADIVFDKTGPGPFGEFYVVFKKKPIASGKKIIIDVGAGLLNNLHTQCHDYVRMGRKQLFISCQMQRIFTSILDYNGIAVRNLYTPKGGRVNVLPVMNKYRKWELLENWASYQYDNFDDQGVGFKTGAYQVTRILVWKDDHFEPKYPGPTTIQDNSHFQESL